VREDDIGTVIVDSAVRLHKKLGPGLLESVYEAIFARQLEKRGLSVERQVGVSIEYEGEQFGEAFRADLIIENKVIIELKSVEQIKPVHKKQLLTYLRLTGLKVGYLLNFNTDLMKNGITRVINGTL